jgi:hypothetical protein
LKAEDVYVLFKEGVRVEVVRCTSYKKYNYKGKLGTVIRNQYGQYGKIIVDLDTEMNPYGASGYFYFKPHELSLVTECNNDILEEDNMQNNVINYINIAKIQYLDNSKPSVHNYANFDSALKKGDLCVVKSLNHGLGLARVIDIVEQNDIQTPREIVAKVDTQDYDFRVAARKDAAELKAKMQERAKQLQDIALYQMLAKNDPDMQELLNRYQNLPLY